MTHHPTPQAKLAHACPFAKPPDYKCSPLTVKEARLRPALPTDTPHTLSHTSCRRAQGGFAKIKTTFNPQVAKTTRFSTNMQRSVRVHLANQHGISMQDSPSCVDEGVQDYSSLMGEGGFVV